jgi:hypothetical protein
MMIAKNWKTKEAAIAQSLSQVIAVPFHIANEFAGAIRRFLPSRRDREVPYGMKGGDD